MGRLQILLTKAAEHRQHQTCFHLFPICQKCIAFSNAANAASSMEYMLQLFVSTKIRYGSITYIQYASKL